MAMQKGVREGVSCSTKAGEPGAVFWLVWAVRSPTRSQDEEQQSQVRIRARESDQGQAQSSHKAIRGQASQPAGLGQGEDWMLTHPLTLLWCSTGRDLPQLKHRFQGRGGLAFRRARKQNQERMFCILSIDKIMFLLKILIIKLLLSPFSKIKKKTPTNKKANFKRQWASQPWLKLLQQERSYRHLLGCWIMTIFLQRSS